jgi:hypothetical protein
MLESSKYRLYCINCRIRNTGNCTKRITIKAMKEVARFCIKEDLYEVMYIARHWVSNALFITFEDGMRHANDYGVLLMANTFSLFRKCALHLQKNIVFPMNSRNLFPGLIRLCGNQLLMKSVLRMQSHQLCITGFCLSFMHLRTVPKRWLRAFADGKNRMNLPTRMNKYVLWKHTP